MLSANDPERELGVLVLGVAAFSDGGYVLIRRASEWRVNVRFQTMEHTATSQASLLAAMSRAHQWLASCWAQKFTLARPICGDGSGGTFRRDHRGPC